MIRYEDFTNIGAMGTFVGQLTGNSKVINIETLNEPGIQKYRVWYYRL